MSVVVQGAVLLAILNALGFLFLYDMAEKLSTEPMVITSPPLMISVLTHLLFIGLCSYFVSALSSAFGEKVTPKQSAVIFIWFNILQLAASMIAFLIVIAAGLFAAFVLFLPVIWTFWAVGQYWAELVRSENTFMGFILVVAGLFLTLPVMMLILTVLNVPGAEIVTDV